MLEPHGSPMKWPGTSAEEEAGEAGLQNARAAQTRSQDDAAVHYVFSRDPPEAELSSLAPKQRWAVGDDNIVENQDKWKNAPPMSMNNMQQQVPLKNPQTSQQQFINQAIASSVGTLTMNQSVIGTHPSHLTTNMVHTQLTPLQNHALNNSLAMQNSAMILPQLQGMQNPQLGQQGIYDIHHPGNAIQAMNGISKTGEHLMYLSQAGILAPGTNQFLQQGQNQLGLTPVAAIRNQILSGHGCFGRYLCHIARREPVAVCLHCDSGSEDTAQHTLAECQAWEQHRAAHVCRVGYDLSLTAVVSADERSWEAMVSCEDVMSQKEAAERTRENDPLSV